MVFRVLSSFDDLDFEAVRQNLDSTRKSFAGVNTSHIESSAELLAGWSWLSASDALDLARQKLIQAVTVVQTDDDSGHARSAFYRYWM